MGLFRWNLLPRALLNNDIIFKLVFSEKIRLKILDCTPAGIYEAVAILDQGGLLGLPTETVYGLAADARNESALQRIFQTKGRPADHPLIVHIGNPEELGQWVQDVPPLAEDLIQNFWPGPLTLILPARSDVSRWVTGGQSKVAVRCPALEATQSVLKTLGRGVCAPSANRFGRISPTTAQHVLADLGTSIEAILDAGPCRFGLESTIVDLSVEPAVILRPGALAVEQIAQISGYMPQILKRAQNTRTSGLLDKHYAPRKPVQLCSTSQLQDPDLLSSAVYSEAVILSIVRPACPGLWLEMPVEADQYAQQLYDALRQADASDKPLIVIESPPQQPQWLAIHDRIERASR